MPPESEPPFPFLALPPEIRNEIYRYLLTRNGPVRSPHRPRQYAVPTNLQPCILATNRQIHNEALRILYQENRLEIYVSDAVYLPTCCARNMHMVESYNVLLDVGMVTRERMEELVARLAECARVGDLRVEIPLKATPARMHMVKVKRLLEPFRSLRGVGKVEFIGCMKPWAAMDLKRIMESQVGVRCAPLLAAVLIDLTSR
ncbi:MAG: hypothetical protein M1840_000094 [Geoglossum simile]|nr:MAG: hypothetical protein M1840_000094 [Geoglossum simile]